ncbi:MAG: tRNA preQ1(34) S-adenosylmethionine ribosyltransferase-isomerase QueA [Gammaproteobacteria bacterium]|nr:tRNA preQ1(34) S-adenosylmethionine ribosyltransferase-isomerase QueA [Pseudomonadota bacterium]MDG2302087.1 tRNA preQ1(34) S-adenosylmethionine ribosyltransferase-isomerase QueA [Gammaproteobacteria bacterium]MBT6194111.1 tRNA preQ1(34) S-adenosylmethionine ribosyltransferase-isomerase QueA [Pseudomonadota bacterium]MBT6465412.1 tRNA preQ1(34) S-adenosylmethionine ribosyltransferase-isomerase QueA [Pseudomonadota bacterium]MBT6675025.1 tRNA preQ1(34) S-adenosylmethionine ribosyltransferase-
MELEKFRYFLPKNLVAQAPLKHRRDARLLVSDNLTGEFQDRRVLDLLGLFRAGDLLVLNDTKVIPARLRGRKDSGGRVEILVERIVSDSRALAHVKSNKTPKSGSVLILNGKARVKVLGREGSLFILETSTEMTFTDLLSHCGELPLPPYITRSPTALDESRYQTVFAKNSGAVAAPTAGLHIDEKLLLDLKELGVDIEYVTLHVGAGTFQPIKSSYIDEHVMHSERVDVSDSVCLAVRETHKRGGRVVAAGTTVVRALEAAALGKDYIQKFQGETNIFIRDGFDFCAVDVLLTNFHLPCSTLLILVSAFAGYEHIFKAYHHAIEKEYRFFSYGDAMWLERDN